jgi:hypothetical protein
MDEALPINLRVTTQVALDSEVYREYSYADGSKFRINAPSRLFVLDNGSHRIIDADGVTHRPSPGYIGISWRPVTGRAPFVA